jgi:hypothetical protein
MVGSHLRFPILSILLLTGVAASGQRFDGPVHGLAQKIAAAVKPHAPLRFLSQCFFDERGRRASNGGAMEREFGARDACRRPGPDGNEVR